jgi:hypothetical protein
MIRRIAVFALLLFIVSITFTVLTQDRSEAVGFDTKIFRAAAIGLVVKETGPGLNKFINTLTFQSHVPIGMSTKVVPILSIGEKGYVGAAQVAGPTTYVNSVQAVWLYEDNFSGNEFRLKVLVPSASLNPLQLKRVQKVGLSAVIDVSLGGEWKGQTFSRSVRAGDILKAGVVAVAINAAAGSINNAINSITKGYSANTKVVPIATIGDKAYIGGAQVSGPADGVRSVKAVFQYEDIFDGGRFRIKAFVPSNSTSPLKIKRVSGVGITALIDTSIADQQRIRERERFWRTTRGKYSPIDVVLVDRFRVEGRHDQGLHKGWYIGKVNQRKLLTGIWIDRYGVLSHDDREAFIIWWNVHHKDKPDVLEGRWRVWVNERKDKDRVKIQIKDRDDDRGKGKSEGKGKGKKK